MSFIGGTGFGINNRKRSYAMAVIKNKATEGNERCQRIMLGISWKISARNRARHMKPTKPYLKCLEDQP